MASFMDREKFLEHYMEIQQPLRAYLRAAIGDLHEASEIEWQELTDAYLMFAASGGH